MQARLATVAVVHCVVLSATERRVSVSHRGKLCKQIVVEVVEARGNGLDLASVLEAFQGQASRQRGNEVAAWNPSASAMHTANRSNANTVRADRSKR